MKKLFFFGAFLLALGMGFVSCGSDDEEGNETPDYVYDTFDEPYLGFGASALQIKEACQGKELLAEDGEVLMYAGRKKAAFEAYYLEELRLEASMVFCGTEAVEADEIVGFLNERYKALGGEDMDEDGEDDTWIYSDSKRNLGVILTVDVVDEDVYWTVGYGKLDLNEAKKKAKGLKGYTIPKGMKQLTTGMYVDALKEAVNK